MESWNEVLKELTSKNNLDDYKYSKKPQCLVVMLKSLIANDDIRKVVKDYIDTVSSSNTFVKSSVKSLSFREEGNVLYSAKDFKGCIICYTKAIIHAKYKSLELASAYSNRSAALYHTQEWEACIEDILLSIQNGYPKNKQFKLNKRLAYCWLYLNNYTKANEVLQNTELDSEISANLTKLDKIDLNRLRSKLKAMDLVQPVLQKDTFTDDNFKSSSESQENLPFASAKVDLKIQDNGRSIISNYDIEAGYVIFMEPAFASVNLQVCYEEELFICNYCCSYRINPVPCHECCDIVYCTETCRLKSWEKYHRWECNGTQNGLWKQVGISHLAARILMQSANSFTQVLSIIKQHNLDSDETSEEASSNNAAQILQLLHDSTFPDISCNDLMQNFEQNCAFVISLVSNLENIEQEDFLKYCLTSMLISVYFKEKTDFFDHIVLANKEILMDIQEWTVLITALILQHICQLICNAHVINRYKDLDRKDSQFYQIATALFPVISIMNHSCDPNITTSFSGRTQIVKAIRSIKKGEEIFNCYGPHFRKMGFDERQSILQKQYHFKCECSACTDPEKSNIYETFSAYNCYKCDSPLRLVKQQGRCKNCNVVNIGKSMMLLNTSREQMNNLFDNIKCKSRSEVKRMVLDICDAHQYCLYKNHMAFIRLYGWTSSVLAGLEFFVESVEFMKSTVAQAEFVCGMNSLEIGDCYNTYTTILWSYLEYAKQRENVELYNDLRAEVRKTIEKAIFVYGLHFAEETITVRKLQEKLLLLDIQEIKK